MWYLILWIYQYVRYSLIESSSSVTIALVLAGGKLEIKGWESVLKVFFYKLLVIGWYKSMSFSERILVIVVKQLSESKFT